MNLAATPSRVETGLNGFRISTLFEEAGKRLQQFRIYRRTLAELSLLDDREIQDLGLSREMLPALAREAARKA